MQTISVTSQLTRLLVVLKAKYYSLEEFDLISCSRAWPYAISLCVGVPLMYSTNESVKHNVMYHFSLNNFPQAQ